MRIWIAFDGPYREEVPIGAYSTLEAAQLVLGFTEGWERWVDCGWVDECWTHNSRATNAHIIGLDVDAGAA